MAERLKDVAAVGLIMGAAVILGCASWLVGFADSF